MRTRAFISVIFLILAACLAASARTDETLEELKARAAKARVEEQPELCVEIAERQLTAADKLYTDGKTDLARSAVDDVVHYSEMARDAAVKSGKALKHTEIAVRKMAAKLRDIKRSLSFEDQPPVDAAAQRLEDLRTDLLVRMFGKGQ